MNQKDKDKILARITAMEAVERSDILFFLLGYCGECPYEFWEGCALFLHLDIK